jgi:Flp pilus assembly protein TadG
VAPLHRSFTPRQRAQALVEFAFILPVTLILLLGMIDLGRAFVFGVTVQEGAREAARLAAKSAFDATVTDAAVLGRLVASSNPALISCPAVTTANQVCGGGTWTFTLGVTTPGGTTYTTIAAARAADALAGSQVTVTAAGSVALCQVCASARWASRSARSASRVRPRW